MRKTGHLLAIIVVTLAMIATVIWQHAQPISINDNTNNRMIHLEATPGYYLYPNQPTTVHWDVEGIKGIYFNDEGVIGSGERPAIANRCDSITWQIVFEDETVEDYYLPVVPVWTTPLFLALLTILFVLLLSFDVEFSSFISRLPILIRQRILNQSDKLIIMRGVSLVTLAVLFYSGFNMFPLECEADSSFLIYVERSTFKLPIIAPELTVIAFLFCMVMSLAWVVRLLRKNYETLYSIKNNISLLVVACLIFMIVGSLRPEITRIFRIFMWGFVLSALTTYAVLATKSYWKVPYTIMVRRLIFLVLFGASLIVNIDVISRESTLFNVRKSNSLHDLNPAIYHDLVVYLRENFFGFSVYLPSGTRIAGPGLSWAGTHYQVIDEPLELTEQQATELELLEPIVIESTDRGYPFSTTVIFAAPVFETVDQVLWGYVYDDRIYMLSNEMKSGLDN